MVLPSPKEEDKKQTTTCKNSNFKAQAIQQGADLFKEMEVFLFQKVSLINAKWFFRLELVYQLRM